MPNAKNGFMAAFWGLVISVLVSTFITIFVQALGGSEDLGIFGILIYTIVGIFQLERVNYWGLNYTIGYLVGVSIVGNYLMEDWEFMVTLIILVSYTAVKMTRKAKRYY